MFRTNGFDASFSGCDVLSPYLTVAFTTRALVGSPQPAWRWWVRRCLCMLRDEMAVRPFATDRPVVHVSFGVRLLLAEISRGSSQRGRSWRAPGAGAEIWWMIPDEYGPPEHCDGTDMLRRRRSAAAACCDHAGQFRDGSHRPSVPMLISPSATTSSTRRTSWSGRESGLSKSGHRARGADRGTVAGICWGIPVVRATWRRFGHLSGKRARDYGAVSRKLR